MSYPNHKHLSYMINQEVILPDGGICSDGRVCKGPVKGVVGAIDCRPFRGGKDGEFLGVRIPGFESLVYVESCKAFLPSTGHNLNIPGATLTSVPCHPSSVPTPGHQRTAFQPRESRSSPRPPSVKRHFTIPDYVKGEPGYAKRHAAANPKGELPSHS